MQAAAEILTAPRAPGAQLPDLQQNYRFHFTLYRASRSDVLVPMVEALWLQYGAFLNLIIQQSAAAEIDEHVFHHALITAIEQGDRAAAQAALAQDIERSFHLIAPADPKETSS